MTHTYLDLLVSSFMDVLAMFEITNYGRHVEELIKI